MRQFSPEEVAAAAVGAQADFYFFARWMFLQRRGYAWKRAPHHKLICDALTDVFEGRCKRLIINIPPRYSKTELAVINWVAWCLGKVPDAEFIHASYSGTLAALNSWQTREMVQHEAYRAIFPGTLLRSDSSAKNEWRTTAGGIMYAVGEGGTITGYGAGKDRPGFGGAIIIDDPHKADEATSDTVRKGVLSWYQNTLESRQNKPGDTPIILIMQRLHEEDLAGWLEAGGSGEEWRVIRLPALCDSADDPLGRELGEPLWPEKHSAEQLEAMAKAKPYVFAGQYQQRPSPLGGGILKGSHFRRWSALPRMAYRTIYADTAQKTKEHNDYSVFQCWGKSAETGDAYLIDQIRGKWEAPELLRRATDFWNKHNAQPMHLYGALRALKVEDKSSGTGLIQTLRVESSIPVLPIQRDKDKFTRALDIQGYLESGRAWIPEEAPWVSEYVAEFDAFTPDDTHAHDDQIDPTIDAINELVATGNTIDLWTRLAGD